MTLDTRFVFGDCSYEELDGDSQMENKLVFYAKEPHRKHSALHSGLCWFIILKMYVEVSTIYLI